MTLLRTPPHDRLAPRRLERSPERWRDAGALVCVRINPPEGVGHIDLKAVMPARPDIVAYPKASSVFQIRALDVDVPTYLNARRLVQSA